MLNNNTTMDNKHIIALEIGSSSLKICAAGVSDSGITTLESVETRSLHGSVRYGRIVNIDEVSKALSDAIQSLEERPGFSPAKILGVYVGIGGRSLGTVNTRVGLALPDDKPISQNVIDRLENEAAQAVPEGRIMLRVIPLRYTIDDLPTQKPVGGVGSRIEAEYTVVYCDPRNMRNIEAVVNQRLGLDICGVSVRPLAIADMCLQPVDTKPGCMLADIGDQTTTVAIFKDCALRYLATIPIGSHHITNDLSIGLGITEEEAENIKCNQGNALPDASSQNSFQVNVDKYINARVNDIVANIVAYIEFAGFKPTDLSGGIIITGRGSKLKNFGKLLENRSRMKVRKATARIAFEIVDTSVVESDMIDLLALSAQAVKLAASPEASPCIELPEIVDEPNKTGFGIDENDDEYTYHSGSGDNYAPSSYDYEYEGFNSYDDAKYKSRRKNLEDNSNDDVDEEYLLEDDDKAEQLRLRDERRKAERENADVERKKQRERKRVEEPKGPSKFAKAIAMLMDRVSDLVSEPTDDDDLDAKIEK